VALAFTCAAHQSSDMLYSPVLAQADNKETTAVIVRTFMCEIMASATESECRTQPAFCGGLLRTAPTSHADTPYLLQIAHWPIQLCVHVRDIHVSFIYKHQSCGHRRARK
jgi:hypothetical protein